MRWEIKTWEDLTIGFSHTFNFVNVDPVIHSTLQHIRNVVLEIVPVEFPKGPHEMPVTQLMMECYNVTREPDDEDNPRNINITESEGSWDIAAP